MWPNFFRYFAEKVYLCTMKNEGIMTYSKDNLTIEVSEHGAELTSLKCNGHEYLWNGDAAYWNRHSPVLFPVVGKPFNNEIRVDGKVYPMKQHGFARDSEFEKMDIGPGICFRMKDTDRQEVYPYRFGLEVAYVIQGNTLTVSWYVENLDERKMYYQIGAHPAFLLPDYDPRDEIHGYVRFYDNYRSDNRVVSPVLTSELEDGNRVPRADGDVHLPSELPITADTFAHDALMIENGYCKQEVSQVTLFDKQGNAVLSVDCFDADAYGIWAPHKPGCPFVCLEPWQGICDKKGFTGDISERDIIRCLNPGDHGHFEYTITIEKKINF